MAKRLKPSEIGHFMIHCLFGILIFLGMACAMAYLVYYTYVEFNLVVSIIIGLINTILLTGLILYTGIFDKEEE